MTLEAHGLQVRRGDRTVITGLTLSAVPGELIGVLGPNGAGKSTLLKALAHLLPVTSGQIALDARPIAAWDRAALGRTIAYLPQERIVHWPLSVRATVALGRFPHDDAASAAGAAAIDRALAEMDVAAVAGRPVSELSGGELARVLMARALAQETAVLLADEPTAGLDPAHQLALFDRLAALARAGRTVLAAMHDLSLAARYCTRVVLLKDGRMLADGPPRDVLTEPRLAEAFGIRARLATVDGVTIVVPLSNVPG